MKKVTRILMLTILVFTLSNCEISTKKANASEKYMEGTYSGNGSVQYSYFTKDNMQYMVIHAVYGGASTINLTKDALEVKLLKKQLNER